MSGGSGATAWPRLGPSWDSGRSCHCETTPQGTPPGVLGYGGRIQDEKSDLGQGPACCPMVLGKVLGLLNASSSKWIIVTMRLKGDSMWKAVTESARSM